MAVSGSRGEEPLMEFRLVGHGDKSGKARRGNTTTHAPTHAQAPRSPRHDPAPHLFLRSPDGRPHSLDEFRGTDLVLQLFDGDEKAAAREARALEANLERFQELNATVVGIAPSGLRAQRRFAKKNGLHFMLLSDRERVLSSRLGRPHGHAMIIIDRDGRVDKVFESRGHRANADRALRHLEAIRREEEWEADCAPPDPDG